MINLYPSAIRNVLGFYRDPIKFLASKSTNSINSFRMAHLPFHHLTGLEEIKQVMVYEQKKFIKTPQAQYYTSLALGEGLVSTDGEEWIAKRQQANPIFKTSVIDKLVNTMDKASKEALNNSIHTKNTSSLKQLMLDVSLEVICQLVFGFSEKENIATISQAMETMIVETYQRVIAPVNLPLFLPSPSNKRFNQSRKAYDQIIWEMTQKSLNQQQKEGLVHQFINHSQLAVDAISIALKTIIAAGHETTATTLTWLLFELGRNPKIEQQLKHELKSLSINKLKNTHDLLNQTTYSQQVINETLRLYPPIWLMGRMANEAVKIGNKLFHKKDNVLISPFIIHRLPEYWEHPTQFNPDRFHNKSLDFMQSAYFPFGLGPRQCIGGHLAIVEMLIILTNLYQGFDLTIQSEQSVQYHPYITLRPAQDISIKLRPIRL